MSDSDLLVLVPWVVFAAGVAVVCLRLRRSGRSSRRTSAGHPVWEPESGAPGEVPRTDRQPAEHDQRGASHE
jgi:hypothetical protein